MAILGNVKQENKIEELSSVAHKLLPNLDKMAIKGCLRKAVKSALEKKNLESWDQVAGQATIQRERFFQSILTELTPLLLRLNLDRQEVDNLHQLLLRENKKYLQE